MRRGGLWPSMGAGASLVAAGVVVQLLVAGVFGARVWPDPPGAGEHGSVTLPAADTPPGKAVAARPSESPPRMAAATAAAPATERRTTRTRSPRRRERATRVANPAPVRTA